MHRSETVPFSLPKIPKICFKQSQYNHTQNRLPFNPNLSKLRNSNSFTEDKHSFMTRVQQQVLEQNEYPYIETSNIVKEHGKLKDLLKSFNQETVNILEKYVIDKPVKKQFVKKKHPIQEMHFIKEKETENANSMIQILKYEIEKLQARCQNLKYISKEQFQHKIKQLKQEKRKIIIQNKEISRQITLNGLLMIRENQSIVKELEYEQLLINTKRDRLQKYSESVSSQIALLQSKIKEITLQIEKFEQEESFTLKQFEQMQKQKSQNRLYDQMEKKKKILEHNRAMNQSTNFQLKHKYFQKLKELDEFTTKDDEFNNRKQQYEQMIEKAKLSICDLEKKQSQTFSSFKRLQSKVFEIKGP